ncbi:MAG: hypothetical protein R3F46_00630 [bacterium]
MILPGILELESALGLGQAIVAVVILLALIPLGAWAMGRLGGMGVKVWEDQKNEIDMEFYRPRFEERHAARHEDPADQASRGRYDLQVEELLAQRRLDECRAFCQARLDDGLNLPSAAERDMYERYLRVIEELRA